MNVDNNGIHQFVDQNAYKLSCGKNGRGGTQKFRHVLFKLETMKGLHLGMNGARCLKEARIDKENVIDVLSRWYNKIEHNNERTFDYYDDKYYSKKIVIYDSIC